MHIPPGFNTVAPYIFVNDASACVDFLVNGLGGTEILRHLDGSRIANAQVRIGPPQWLGHLPQAQFK